MGTLTTWTEEVLRPLSAASPHPRRRVTRSLLHSRSRRPRNRERLCLPQGGRVHGAEEHLDGSQVSAWSWAACLALSVVSSDLRATFFGKCEVERAVLLGTEAG